MLDEEQGHAGGAAEILPSGVQLELGRRLVAAVERQKVPRRAYVTLRQAEIPVMLAAVPPQWRDLFTVAV